MPKVSPNRSGRLCHGQKAKCVDTDPANAGGYSPMTQMVVADGDGSTKRKEARRATSPGHPLADPKLKVCFGDLRLLHRQAMTTFENVQH